LNGIVVTVFFTIGSLLFVAVIALNFGGYLPGLKTDPYNPNGG
jgi:hypothetical protein